MTSTQLRMKAFQPPIAILMGFSLMDNYQLLSKNKSYYGNKAPHSVVGEGMSVVRTMQSKRLGVATIARLILSFNQVIKFLWRNFPLEIKESVQK